MIWSYLPVEGFGYLMERDESGRVTRRQVIGDGVTWIYEYLDNGRPTVCQHPSPRALREAGCAVIAPEPPPVVFVHRELHDP